MWRDPIITPNGKEYFVSQRSKDTPRQILLRFAQVVRSKRSEKVTKVGTTKLGYEFRSAEPDWLEPKAFTGAVLTVILMFR